MAAYCAGVPSEAGEAGDPRPGRNKIYKYQYIGITVRLPSAHAHKW